MNQSFRLKVSFKDLLTKFIFPWILLLIFIDLVRGVFLFKLPNLRYVNYIFLLLEIAVVVRIIIKGIQWKNDPYIYFNLTDQKISVKDPYFKRKQNFEIGIEIIDSLYCIYEGPKAVHLHIVFRDGEEQKEKKIYIIRWDNVKDIILKLRDYAEQHQLSLEFVNEDHIEPKEGQFYMMDLETLLDKIGHQKSVIEIIKGDLLSTYWLKIGFLIVLFLIFTGILTRDGVFINNVISIIFIIIIVLMLLRDIFFIYYRKKEKKKKNAEDKSFAALITPISIVFYAGMIFITLSRYFNPVIFNNFVQKFFSK